jgi:hypothetical protein
MALETPLTLDVVDRACPDPRDDRSGVQQAKVVMGIEGWLARYGKREHSTTAQRTLERWRHAANVIGLFEDLIVLSFKVRACCRGVFAVGHGSDAPAVRETPCSL